MTTLVHKFMLMTYMRVCTRKKTALLFQIHTSMYDTQGFPMVCYALHDMQPCPDHDKSVAASIKSL